MKQKRIIYDLALFNINKKRQKPISEELKNGSYVMLFCMLLVFDAFWGLKEAKDIKNTYSSKIIRIDNMYTGDGENKFIRETSNYYFIYKTKSSTVSVYNKADLALVEVEPNKYRRKEIKDSDNDLKKFLIKLKTKIIK